MKSTIQNLVVSTILAVGPIASASSNAPQDLSVETRRVILAYFNAWTSHNIDEAYAQLADDVYVQGPTGGARNAVEFRPGLEAFAAMTKSAQIISFVVE